MIRTTTSPGQTIRWRPDPLLEWQVLEWSQPNESVPSPHFTPADLNRHFNADAGPDGELDKIAGDSDGSPKLQGPQTSFRISRRDRDDDFKSARRPDQRFRSGRLDRYLNIGYQLPLVAVSDNMDTESLLGGVRTYAHLGSRDFT